MVSYGDSEFRQWAADNKFNDDDLALIGREVNKRKWIWVLIWLLAHLIALGQSGLVPEPFATICTVIGGICTLIFWFGISFMIKCMAWSKIVRRGTLDPKPGLIQSLFGIMMIITWISVIPLIIYLVSKNKLWGTGINKLIKKGLIGNH